ncbi:MAG: hypothetical protein P4N60_06985 [Verrucomicrobiae bacterium]|nr:hypothetical protein [Verrucomicrobiae bacterium]
MALARTMKSDGPAGTGPGIFIEVFKLLAIAVCAIAIGGKIAAAPQFIFNDGRLAPVFSMLHGNPPFYAPGTGPMLNTVYGPLSYVYYFPCGCFIQNISLAIMAGSVLSLLAFVIPLGIILLRQRDRFGGREMFWLGALCLLQVLAYGGLSSAAFIIHADAPAVLFASLCVLALGWGEAGITSRRALWISAACGVLAIWSKQTYAAVLLMPLAVMLMEKHSWKQRLALLGWIASLNAILLWIFSLWCGFGAVEENLLKIPGAIPSGQVLFLYAPDPHAAGGVIGHLRSLIVSIHIMFGKYLAPYLLCFLFYLFFRIKNGGTATAGSLALLVPRISGFFFLAALLNLPLAADSATKIGAAANDDTPFAWFLILGIFCLIVEKKQNTSPPIGWQANRAVYAIFATIALLYLAVATAHLPKNLRTIAHAFDNDEATIAAVCRQSPGKYYFPWNPAAVYAGERKLYNWQYIAELRGLAGRPITPDQFYRYLPPNASTIGLPVEYVTVATNFLSRYFQNLQACAGPAAAPADRFAWYSFERRP